MEAKICCRKYHGKKAHSEPIGPTTGPAHLTTELSLTNDSHIFFLYLL